MEEPDIAAHFIEDMDRNTKLDSKAKERLLSGSTVSVIVGGMWVQAIQSFMVNIVERQSFNLSKPSFELTTVS